jgi:hypothetical protein
LDDLKHTVAKTKEIFACRKESAKLELNYKPAERRERGISSEASKGEFGDGSGIKFSKS